MIFFRYKITKIFPWSSRPRCQTVLYNASLSRLRLELGRSTSSKLNHDTKQASWNSENFLNCSTQSRVLVEARIDTKSDCVVWYNNCAFSKTLMLIHRPTVSLSNPYITCNLVVLFQRILLLFLRNKCLEFFSFHQYEVPRSHGRLSFGDVWSFWQLILDP